MLAARLAAVVAAWREAWGMPAGDEPLACDGVDDSATSRPWTPLAQDGPAACWCSLQQEWAQPISAALFGIAPAQSPMASELVALCASDLGKRLAAALGLAQAAAGDMPPPALPIAPWSGALLARLLPGLDLLLNGPAVARQVQGARPASPAPAGTGAGLVQLPQALGPLPVTLQVQLEGGEFEIGAVQDLRPGDVIRLHHAVERPATVLDAAGRPLFRGFLARTAARKAVELAAACPGVPERP